jgi:hydrogenase nickel incorporation protein HypA/HybF
VYEELLMRALVGRVESFAREHASAAVDNVCIRIGPLSGLEPQRLKTAFEQVATSPILAGARLMVQEAPLTQRCQDCGAVVQRQQPGFGCPACGSSKTVVLQGDSLLLESVELIERAQPPARAKRREPAVQAAC